MTDLNIDDLKWNSNILKFYFVYVTFHGALRKWVFAGVGGGISEILFLLQLILPFVVVFALRRKKSILSCKPLLPYAILLTIMALNPMNQTLYHGIFGFILHFGFWLLMLMYLNEPEAFPIETLVNTFIIVSVTETILTFFQFTLPNSHFLNRYENANLEDIVGFDNDGGVRVVGTFTYVGGYGSFIFFLGLLVWALMLQRKLPTLYLLILSGFGLISSFMNGSRSMMLPYVLFVFFGFLSYGGFVDKIKPVIIMACILPLLIIFNLGEKFSFIEKAYNSFNSRVIAGRQTGEANQRTLSTFTQITDFAGKYPIAGIGLGATYQGATAKWGKSLEYVEFGYCEEEPERIILEGGFVLFITRVFLFGLIAFKSKIPIYFSMPTLFYIFFFTLFVFNTYQASYVFLGLALLDKVYAQQKLSNNESYSE